MGGRGPDGVGGKTAQPSARNHQLSIAEAEEKRFPFGCICATEPQRQGCQWHRLPISSVTQEGEGEGDFRGCGRQLPSRDNEW